MPGDFPDELRYTVSDEWVRAEGPEMTLGITGFAAEQLGDVVYVQLPEIGKHFNKSEAFGEIESVKAVSDLYCPLAGTILAVNDEIDQNPGIVNENPYGRGWLVRFQADNPEDYHSLLSAQEYEQSTKDR